MKVQINTFDSRDLDGLIHVWNNSLHADPISPAKLEAQVLLDPNFREEFCLVAHCRDRLAGFVLGICGEGIHFPGERQGKKGWILAFGVEASHQGRGVGSALLSELERRFQEAGKKDIWMASYPTAYITPGVDETAYADGLAFLTNREYRVAYTALAMSTSIWPARSSDSISSRRDEMAEQGIHFDIYHSQWLSAFRRFLQNQVPWDWERLALRNLNRIGEGTFRPEQFHLAIAGEDVVGYCQYEEEHFGPFGVAQGFQGRGIGTVLLGRTLQSMARHGLHNAWVLWTGERTARLYARFGFKETRRFAVLHKELD